MTTAFTKSWRERIEEMVGDVGEVVCLTVRDDTCVRYEVLVARRSLSESAVYGRPRTLMWSDEVYFGQTDASLSGGSAFVAMARKQEQIAAGIWAQTRGR